jgi:hypothetical protein
MLTEWKESGNTDRLYSEERENIRHHKRGSRTAETKATEKNSKQFQPMSLAPQEGKRKRKTSLQGKPDGSVDKLARLAAR